MGGFVVFGEDAVWPVSNVVWRGVFEPVAGRISPGTPAASALASAMHGGIHSLDLSDVAPSDVRRLAGVVRSVRDDYASGGLPWDGAVALTAFLGAIDSLLGILDARSDQGD